MLTNKEYDLVVCDLNMPIMDGFQACKNILQFYYRYNRNILIYGDN